MTDSARPTKKQRELLSFIKGFVTGHGYGPSYREIMRALGYKSVSTVAIHIDNLVKKGHLQKRYRSARSVEVLTAGAEFKDSNEIKKSDEKWLVNQINKRFTALDSGENNAKQIDDLYVLVGALHVLGFKEPAKAFKVRLAALSKK